MVDYRLSENRIEAYIKWYAWELHYLDCDPPMWMMNYLNRRYEHNTEQRLWFCWLYGNTYYLPTAWVIMNEFPDYELVTLDRMEWWNTANYKRTRYQTDCKYNKGFIPVMFSSYQKVMGKRLQQDVLESQYGQTERQNFDNLWKFINKNYYKFGRYTTWFYLQTLFATAGIKVEPTSLMLNDYDGSKSHRNGLIYALGWDDWLDTKLAASEYASLEAAAVDLMQETKARYPHLQVDAFSMETALCAFKKIFRNYDSRYLGYYLDRAAEEITKVSQDGWPGIEWDVLWQAREETLDPRLVTRTGIDKSKFDKFYNTGHIDRLDWLEENAHRHIRHTHYRQDALSQAAYG